MQYKQGDLEVKLGNAKIGDDTLIFNMGTAQDCPSRKRGLCKLGNKCYALKAEKLYHHYVPAYRKRQEKYWKNNTGLAITCDFVTLLETRKRHGKKLAKSIKYLRINESGDFWTQGCIEKLCNIADYLKRKYGIITYTYTARKDLDFSSINFRLHTSGWKQGAHGKTIARKKVWKDTDAWHYENTGETFRICPMDCTKCDLCKVTDNNIVFPLH